MNYSALLENQGYTLNSDTSVYMRPEYAGISYSDGDEVEERIAKIIKNSSDLSIFSRELAVECTDWPSLYHLGSNRANILRPFHSLLQGANVLEIGAGCGAMTRYLGECGANVLALEGTPRRAAIARSRTRDLENVTVLAESFDQFQCGDYRFDVITFIGVLEYAALFTEGEEPAVSMLSRVRELLKPDGKLILAIENQLGLKYFAGAAEDHTGEPMLGVEGRYTDKGPRTFGRKVLGKLLERAGFTNQQWMAPFPDYKLPISIVTEQGLNCDDFDSAALAWQSVHHDPQLPAQLVFAPELVWQEVAANGLTLDLANSFLVFAAAAANVDPESESEILAYHYSTNERKAEFCKETLFIRQPDNHITIRYNPLGSNSERIVEGNCIYFNISNDSEYFHGKPLSLQMMHIVSHDNWNIKEIGIFLCQYLDIVKLYINKKREDIIFKSITTLIPGICFDIVPQNIILTDDGIYKFIDQEWIFKGDMPLGWLLFRALQPIAYNISQIEHSTGIAQETWFNLLIAIFTEAGFTTSREDLEIFVALEEKVQKEIKGIDKSSIKNFSWDNKISFSHKFFQEAIKKMDENLKMEQKKIAIIQDKKNLLQDMIYKMKISQTKSRLEMQNLQIRLDNMPTHLARLGAVSWKNNCPVAPSSKNESVLSKTKSMLDRLSRQKWIQLNQLRELIRKIPLFDISFYYQIDPNLATSKVNPLHHYFFHGAKEGRNPNPYFFTSWYLSEYPDVAKANINPLLHFILYGAKEGRNPNPYFFTTWYRNKYLQTNQNIHPLLHYIQYGWKTGAWPNPYFDVIWYIKTYLSSEQNEIEPLAHFLYEPSDARHNPNPHFDSHWYLQTYSWVEKMNMHPVQHYINYGIQQKTNPNPYFDGEWYSNQYPESIRENLCPLAHYLINIDNVNPNPYFDTEWYQTSYPDVAENKVDPLLHYITYGSNERRNPSPYFHTSWYLTKYPDVRDSGINPLLHYIQFGAFECRAPHPNFDAEWYLNKYPEIIETNLSPLLHYIQKGKNEGKLPYDPNRNQDYFDGKIDLNKIFGETSTENSNVYVQILNTPPIKNKIVKLIAFYLPQFHKFPENDAWWGEGFTEWTNVKPAQPQFKGHYQPHIPDELGYYNLLNPSIQHRQIELAKLYGIEGFCFYFYWFAGKTLMEDPINNYINDKNIQFPFCLCWANENWTRRWDGREKDILIQQQHSIEDDLNFIKHISKYLRDCRYIRIENKPLLLIYRPELLPSAKDTAILWRKWCQDNGIGEIYLAYTQSFSNLNPEILGFDAAIEFPPSSLILQNIEEDAFQQADLSNKVIPLHKNFDCSVTDWRIFLYNSTKYIKSDYKIFRGACPSWDNTPRRKNNSTIFVNNSPELYKQWLINAIKDTIKTQEIPDERLIFINAWNEWGEGAYLEPDSRYGYAYLDATRKALLTDLYHNDDEQYFSMLLRSIEDPVVDGIRFPGFPSADIQKGFVGSSNQDTLREAYQFFRLVKRYAAAFGKEFKQVQYNFLDFGCGWGRFLRFFQKDINIDNIYGVDVDPNILEICRESGFTCNLSEIQPTGPLPFQANFFDCIIAYSVFTHLPEDIHLYWMNELARVSKSGCIMVLTLESMRFLDFISSLEETAPLSRWHEKLVKFKNDTEKMKSDFTNGKFVYLPTGGGAYRDAVVYGDAVVPLEYIERVWTSHFNIIDYIDDGSFWQAVLIVQKK